MQRFFSTFPGGLSGLGLLLVRLAIAIIAIAHGAGYFVSGFSPAWFERVYALVSIATGICLLIGFITPVAGVLMALGTVAIGLAWIPSPPTDLIDTRLITTVVIIVAVAAVLLGPGALSLDARLFGRREIIIPPPRAPKS